MPRKLKGSTSSIRGYLEQGSYYDEGLCRIMGPGADAIGLEPGSTPSREVVKNLLLGRSPDGEQRLVHNSGSASRVLGWDLTLKATKEDSVFWSQLPPKEQGLCEEAAWNAAERLVDHASRLAGRTRRGKAGIETLPADLIAIGYLHSTTRARPVPDPLLHIHVIVLNVAVSADGKTRAVHSPFLFKAQSELYFAFHDFLAEELEEKLGVETHSVDGIARVAHVPRGLCLALSSRRREVLDHMERRGLYGPKGADIAAERTRRAKGRTPRRELFTHWRDVGRLHGWSTPQALALIEHTPTPGAELDPSYFEKALNRAIRSYERKHPDRWHVRKAAHRVLSEANCSEPIPADALKVAAKAWRSEGLRVVGAARSRAGARSLERRTGIRSASLAKVLHVSERAAHHAPEKGTAERVIANAAWATGLFSKEDRDRALRELPKAPPGRVAANVLWATGRISKGRRNLYALARDRRDLAVGERTILVIDSSSKVSQEDLDRTEDIARHTGARVVFVDPTEERVR